MKHHQKTRLFKILDRLPSTLGYFLYHQLQNRFSKQTFDQKLKSNEKSLEVVQRILEAHDYSLRGKAIVELGSGWVPIMPYLLKFYCGASTVDTYDVNEHFKSSEISLLNEHFTKNYNITHGSFGGKYKLASGINYFPKTDIRKAKLDHADLVISRFVLEHVPPEIIESIHVDFASKLRSGSFILHLISPSDHRAYSDSSLSLQDFLKYSQSEWNQIQTKFDYHNRLRLPQYLTLFQKDFEIVHVEYNTAQPGTSGFDKFKSLAIHADFKGFTDEELTAGSINVLLRKK